MNPLKYTVSLHPGESFRSFASRLAAANGSRAMLEFCRDMAIDLAAMQRGEATAFDRLASLGGVDGEALQGSSIVNDFPYRILGGQRIVRGFVAQSRLRICPHCIRDDMENGEGPPQSRPWLRSVWSITLVKTCPKHNVLLVEPDVDVPAYFRQDVAVICQNRKAIEAMSLATEAVPASPLEDWMAERLHGGDGDSQFLASLPFQIAVRFTEVVGASILHGRLFKIATFTDREWVEAGRAGFKITSAGEDAVRSHLGTFAANFLSSRKPMGGKAMFGSLYSWLQKPRDPDMEPLRSLVREYAIDNFPIGPGDEFLGLVPRRRWHSIHSAFKEYGLHTKRLRRLLIEAKIVSPEDARLSDHRVMFDAAAVEPLLCQLREGLTVQEAIAYAGVTVRQWRVLTEAGFIRSATERANSTRGAYVKAEIDAFLASVRHRKVRDDPETMTSVSEAAKLARCTILEIVRMLVDRKLARVAVSSRKGFAGILVDPKEVAGLLPPKEKKGLTIPEASIRIGLHEDVLRALVAAGHIPSIATVEFSNRGAARLIREEDVESFAARYASLGEVAQSMGSRSRWKTNERLAAAGIRPAFDRATYGSDVYERASISAVHPR